jgi:hypothetical protein
MIRWGAAKIKRNAIDVLASLFFSGGPLKKKITLFFMIPSGWGGCRDECASFLFFHGTFFL